MHDPKDIWRNQPTEKLEMQIEKFINRRTRQLICGTRYEILISVAVTILFAIFVALRMALTPLQQVVLALAVLWSAVSLYGYRDRIWPQQPDVTVAGVSYYRRQLEQRRDHLRSTWIWYGPLSLAILVFIATLIERSWPNLSVLKNMAPFLTLLVFWVAVASRMRHNQIKALQEEIDELG